MRNRTVLICGAGVAGSTLAYWLARAGVVPTVVERAHGQRSSGSPVDVRGAAVEVVRKMGLLPRLREEATFAPWLTVLTASGQRIRPLALGRPRGENLELSRSDLAMILHEATRDDVEFIFNDSIARLHQDPAGVDVTFEYEAPRRFDLVVGADGLHSRVRELVFGAERDFVRHLGAYIATMPLERSATEPETVVLHSEPGRTVGIHPAKGNAMAVFLFRASAIPCFDHRDTEQHKRIVLAAYRKHGGGLPEFPELLERLRATPDLYFDAVSRVRLPNWTRERVALLGDAASSVTLFGDGSSLAIAGAHTLAEALSANPEQHAKAFRAYESQHRRAVRTRQYGARFSAGLLVPATRTGLAVRNLAARVAPRQSTED